MKLLITGSSGLIGKRFLELHSNKFSEIYSLGRRKNPFNDVNHIYFDLSSLGRLELPQVDVVVHCAAQTSLVFDKREFLNNFNTNSFGTGNLLQACSRMGQKPFFLNLGTATQLGYTNKLYRMKDLPKDSPTTLYDISKLAGEMMLHNFCELDLIRGCSLRLCNVYGNLNERQKSDRGILDKIFRKCLLGKPVEILGDGTYLRDYIHLDDVCDAIYATLNSIKDCSNNTFYIGTGKSIRLKDAFSKLRNVAHKQNNVFSEFRYSQITKDINIIHLRNFQADITEFSKKTGWAPQRSISDLA